MRHAAGPDAPQRAAAGSSRLGTSPAAPARDSKKILGNSELASIA